MKAVRDKLLKYKRDTYLTETEEKPECLLPVIDCEVGYSPFGTSPKALEAIKNFDFAAVARYPEMFYAQMLKPVIQRMFPEAIFNSEQIFFGHGSFNLAERIIHKFVKPLTMVGYGPQFNEIPSEMVAAGGVYLPMPLKKYEFPVEDILKAIDQACSIVYIDNPNNPTGKVIPINIIAEIVKKAEKRGVIVLVDEAYGDFMHHSKSAINLVNLFSNLMVIRSFSKGLGLAAQRIGYMVISEKLVPFYGQIDVPFEPTLLSAVMAKATAEDEEYIEAFKLISRNEKRAIIEALLSRNIVVLPTDNTVSILTAHLPNKNLYERFMRLGIKVENGSAYTQTCEFMDNSYIRLRVPSEKEFPDLIKRLKKL